MATPVNDFGQLARSARSIGQWRIDDFLSFSGATDGGSRRIPATKAQILDTSTDSVEYYYIWFSGARILLNTRRCRGRRQIQLVVTPVHFFGSTPHLNDFSLQSSLPADDAMGRGSTAA